MNTNIKQNACRCAPITIPGSARQQSARPEGAGVEPSHACNHRTPCRNINSMMSDEERTRECCLPAPTFKSRGSTAGGRGFKSDSTCRRQSEQRGMRQRAAAKAHAMQGSSLPDAAAAAAAFNSSAAAHRINTASAGRTSRAATSAGRTRPAN